MKRISFLALLGSLLALLALALGLRPIVRTYQLLQQAEIKYEVAATGKVISQFDINYKMDENMDEETLCTVIALAGCDKKFKVGRVGDYSRPYEGWPGFFHPVANGDMVHIIKIPGINKRHFIASQLPGQPELRQMVKDHRGQLVYNRSLWLLLVAALFGGIAVKIYKPKK